ncbi:hypothetical protein ASC82_01230 [Streptomyces sp. Root431]|uniref:hypothetical protein n=1 Tax=Streptomyces sp. Root431 TaxID=1736535 RepID=UPI0006FD2CEE|nr:hypothetical protein [Streptomyces sp. Root431]KQX16903.1 hypothetical protein ASC82_01230 [Streptomyces sp. Root431]
MGASRWIYFTDKTDDPQVALEDLRQQVFEESWRHEDPYPETIEELIDGGGLEAEGAHSILDVDRVIVSDDIDYEETGTIRVVHYEELIEYFGTNQPTRERIEDVYRKSASNLPPMFRGSGCCAPVYSDKGDRVGLVFWGMSGD